MDQPFIRELHRSGSGGCEFRQVGWQERPVGR
jgi:hypothetical protein